MKLEDIIIKDSFKDKQPNPKKYKLYNDEFEKNGYMKEIVLNEQNVLVDGYIGYLILKNHNYDKELTNVSYLKNTYQNVPTQYVFGHHINNNNIYVWRVPNNKQYNIKVGNRCVVNTSGGIKTITVTDVKVLDKPPINKPIKKVVKVLGG